MWRVDCIDIAILPTICVRVVDRRKLADDSPKKSLFTLGHSPLFTAVFLRVAPCDVNPKVLDSAKWLIAFNSPSHREVDQRTIESASSSDSMTYTPGSLAVIFEHSHLEYNTRNIESGIMK